MSVVHQIEDAANDKILLTIAARTAKGAPLVEVGFTLDSEPQPVAIEMLKACMRAGISVGLSARGEKTDGE